MNKFEIFHPQMYFDESGLKDVSVDGPVKKKLRFLEASGASGVVLINGSPHTIDFAGVQGFDGDGLVGFHREDKDVYEIFWPLTGEVLVVCERPDSKHPYVTNLTTRRLRGAVPKAFLGKDSRISLIECDPFPNLVVMRYGTTYVVSSQDALVVPPGYVHGSISVGTSDRSISPQVFAAKFRKLSKKNLPHSTT